ncbi:unnamed protein product [Bursaphelenchus xylophilus]|uniref:(pine wood nematode) hypothetical protein n=1 Tax=Bursaphelenchus xylophilus TaxID=6326 RepID=A0A7I8WZ90_BURXY|nr:unnamed protein product [Bursaphelenchus xylophilus]CAG9102150.1 unnamed protein product [Bursaphelenchus xylophilus]
MSAFFFELCNTWIFIITAYSLLTLFKWPFKKLCSKEEQNVRLRGAIMQIGVVNYVIGVAGGTQLLIRGAATFVLTFCDAENGLVLNSTICHEVENLSDQYNQLYQQYNHAAFDDPIVFANIFAATYLSLLAVLYTYDYVYNEECGEKTKDVNNNLKLSGEFGGKKKIFIVENEIVTAKKMKNDLMEV